MTVVLHFFFLLLKVGFPQWLSCKCAVTLTFRICPPSGYLPRISLRNSTSGGAVCPNLPAKGKSNQQMFPTGSGRHHNNVGSSTVTAAFEASSLQCERYLRTSCGQQSTNRHAIIQLQRTGFISMTRKEKNNRKKSIVHEMGIDQQNMKSWKRTSLCKHNKQTWPLCCSFYETTQGFQNRSSSWELIIQNDAA